MVFSQKLVIESTLSAGAARARMRAFATSRDMANLEAFRRRQIVSWRLSKASEDFVFQPEYGDILDIEGAQFVGLVEPTGFGSRIRGHVVAARLTRIVMSTFMLAVVFVAIAALREGNESPAKILSIAAMGLGGALLMLRYGARSTRRLVEARLRRCLEASEASVAA
ncbi:MAG TPA: hypothetical protein VGP84_12115 [Gemmatimonadaceae bacterium]|jgi:hypothetical protein|nr:hypothetical protein [Gemmatimonadaceae bacterium]